MGRVQLNANYYVLHDLCMGLSHLLLYDLYHDLYHVHFYLDRENGSNFQISVAGHPPLPWFGETDTIESAVISARRAKQFSQEFESIRRTFSSSLNRFDVR